METTSKIKSMESKFSEKSNKWYYDITMENWDHWTIWHNNENAYTVWQELKYKLTLKKDSTDKYWMNEVKEKKRWWSQKNYDAEFIIAAMTCANTYAMAHPTCDINAIANGYLKRMKDTFSSSNQSK